MDRQESRETSSAIKGLPTARFLNYAFAGDEQKSLSEVYVDPPPNEQSYIANKQFFEMMKSPKPAGYESESQYSYRIDPSYEF